jgi:hypothetical protein
MDVKATNRNDRPWWRKKRWWAIMIAIPCVLYALFLQARFTQLRARAVEELRAEMRERAVNWYGVKSIGLTACEAKTFLDPFEVWAEVARGSLKREDFEEVVQREYDETQDMGKLAQWFACQGFKVQFANGVINAGVRTPNGYGPFNDGIFPWPSAWDESFSSGGKVDAHGKLLMDIGTTYE